MLVETYGVIFSETVQSEISITTFALRVNFNLSNNRRSCCLDCTFLLYVTGPIHILVSFIMNIELQIAERAGTIQQIPSKCAAVVGGIVDGDR